MTNLGLLAIFTCEINSRECGTNFADNKQEMFLKQTKQSIMLISFFSSLQFSMI
jgi:hypothetical protein